MTRSRRVIIAIVIFVTALLALLFWPERIKVSPPTLSLLRVENAGILDDNDVEMWLVTLCISNQNQMPSDRDRYVYVEDINRPIEARVENRWLPIEGRLGCFIAPSLKHEILFLMPARTTSCRAAVKYTGSRLSKGRMIWLAERLPRSVRVRLPRKFWEWAGWFPVYGPDSRWREIEFEVPILASASN